MIVSLSSEEVGWGRGEGVNCTINWGVRLGGGGGGCMSRGDQFHTKNLTVTQEITDNNWSVNITFRSRIKKLIINFLK